MIFGNKQQRHWVILPVVCFGISNLRNHKYMESKWYKKLPGLFLQSVCVKMSRTLLMTCDFLMIWRPFHSNIAISRIISEKCAYTLCTEHNLSKCFSNRSDWINQWLFPYHSYHEQRSVQWRDDTEARV